MSLLKTLLVAWLLLICGHATAAGKLLATPGVSQIEGAAGGGLVPWAPIAGYATDDQWSSSAFCSRVTLKDFRLGVCGAQVNLFDRAEVSYAKQAFRVEPLSLDLEQSITGIKVRLLGDLVYSPWPVVSAGVQHKQMQKNKAVAVSLGAEETSGTDYYFSASKLHLAALGGFNWLWTITARNSEANEIGLLGFGGNGRQWLFEGSTALLLNRHWAVGYEYRQKPDNLNLGEDNWQDIFIAWVPTKSVSLTLAKVDLGKIAGIDNQTGWYLSATGYW